MIIKKLRGLHMPVDKDVNDCTQDEFEHFYNLREWFDIIKFVTVLWQWLTVQIMVLFLI